MLITDLLILCMIVGRLSYCSRGPSQHVHACDFVDISLLYLQLCVKYKHESSLLHQMIVKALSFILAGLLLYLPLHSTIFPSSPLLL